MGQHKKRERLKELDRKRRRREKNLKLRAKEQKAGKQDSRSFLSGGGEKPPLFLQPAIDRNGPGRGPSFFRVQTETDPKPIKKAMASGFDKVEQAIGVDLPTKCEAFIADLEKIPHPLK